MLMVVLYLGIGILHVDIIRSPKLKFWRVGIDCRVRVYQNSKCLTP